MATHLTYLTRIVTAVVTVALGIGIIHLVSKRRGDPPAAYRPFAQIKVSCRGPGELELMLADTGGTRPYVSNGSVFTVHPGSYQLWYFNVLRTDKYGGQWVARSGLESRDDEVFTLRAGEVKRVSAGPPFRASVAVAKAGARQVLLHFKLLGAGGDEYRVTRKKEGDAEGEMAIHRFTITDGTGREVAADSFEYG